MKGKRALRWAWEAAIFASDLAPATRLCMLAVGSMVNERGEAWPSISTLVAMTGLSRRTVMDHVQEANDAGWLLKFTLPGRQSRYLVSIPRGANPAPVTGAKNKPGAGAKAARVTGRSSMPTGANNSMEPVQLAHEPVQTASELPIGIMAITTPTDHEQTSKTEKTLSLGKKSNTHPAEEKAGISESSGAAGAGDEMTAEEERYWSGLDTAGEPLEAGG